MMPNDNRSQPSRSQQSTQQSTGKNVEQKATQASERVAQQAQLTFENARTTVTKQVSAVARAIDSAADTLQQHDQRGLSQRVKQYVEKAENASQYLQDKSPRELKDDLDQFARQKPAWFLGGAFVAGLLGARFLKSSEKKSLDQNQSWKGSVEYART
jgi:uncharacterized membrane protein YdfJ with MMPL/SSD domain